MSDHETVTRRARWIQPMRPRAIDDEHRVATPLELFFDLCFVVAVAQAASGLHHALAEDHLGQALIGYPMAFIAIWWAWMNFTWFASAYDNDDVLYRIAVLVEMAGVLILAAGVRRALDDLDFGIVIRGYAVMRVALIGQWLRAAYSDAVHRQTALRYAEGVTLCAVIWPTLLLLPGRWFAAGWVVMMTAELIVPAWAEQAGSTTWHPGHIAERYGLFTLIVLGEAVLAATTAAQSALDANESLADVAGIASGGLLIVFSMWWLYFAHPREDVVGRLRLAFGSTRNSGGFIWGYGHLVVFASAAAVGAGLAVALDQATGHADLSARAATAAVAVPVALFVSSSWVLHAMAQQRSRAAMLGLPTASLVMVAAALATSSVLLIGVLLVVMVVISIRREVTETVT